jgi:hypothetical protein
MSELNGIGLRHNSDKADSVTARDGKRVPGNNLLFHYEQIIKSWKDNPITILELGVGLPPYSGGSMRVSNDYFKHPGAKFVGVDISETANQVAGGRTYIEIGDCGNREFLAELGSRYRPHLLIDDASHIWQHQIDAFEVLFPFVLPGGLFIIEDIHTSFGNVRRSYAQSAPFDAFQYVLGLTTSLVGGGQHNPIEEHLPKIPADVTAMIDHIICVPKAIIIRKKS